jgi:hypothetical protein
MDPPVNPFAVLSLIVAPAVLTNASSVLVMSTSNRLACAVDRTRELSKQLEEAGDDICARRLLRGIGLDSRPEFQCDDTVLDEGACTLPLEGQGHAFAIRRFKRDVGLQRWLVLFCDVEDPSKLVCNPFGLEVMGWLCHSLSGCTRTASEQDDPAWFHTDSFSESVDTLHKKYGKHTVVSGASFLAHQSAQHDGERGHLPDRQQQHLPGETKRKRLGIPISGMALHREKC